MDPELRGAFDRAVAASAKPGPVEWGPSEWADEGYGSYYHGIDLDVYPDPEKPGMWVWSVKPSSSRCEYPELYDLGSSRTAQAAMRAAEKSGRRANRSYQHIKY